MDFFLKAKSSMSRTSDSLVKVNSTLKSNRVNLVASAIVLLSVFFIYPMSGRYSTNWDRKGDPARIFKFITTARVFVKFKKTKFYTEKGFIYS